MFDTNCCEFKVGQKVYIAKIGKWGQIRTIKGDRVTLITEDNRLGVGTLDEIEKFIEPKFKVHDKFRVSPERNWVTEIVKTSLNKKNGEYSYLCFDEDGYVRGATETELSAMQKLSKKGKVKTEVKVCCKCKC